MKLQEVDERSAVLEWHETPLYRAEFWTGGEALDWAMEAWDVEAEELTEVLAWCGGHAKALAPCKVVLRFTRPFPTALVPNGLATQVIHTEVVLAPAEGSGG